MTQQIQDLSFVRRVVGFSRIGVMCAPAVIKLASEKANGMAEQGVNLQQTKDTLGYLDRGYLPSAQRCGAAVSEIDRVLVPMRQVERAADTQLTTSVVRERQNT